MNEHSAEEGTTNCAECGAAMAHDQRYCLECGARRSPLPSHVQHVIGGILESGRRVASAGIPTPGEGQPEGDDAEPAEDPGGSDAWLVAPRAAAAAVMGMLGFGVIVGALVGGSAASVLSPLLVAVRPPVQSIPTSPVSAASGGGGSSSSGGGSPAARTITIVQGGGTTPVTPAGGGSGGGSGSGSTTTGTGTTPSGPLPPVKHVFLVMLTNESYQETFGHTSADPYLATTLVKQGFLIPGYYAVAGSPLANEIALISGQGPTVQTNGSCAKYLKITPGTQKTRQQIVGHGCVYPEDAETLGDQLAAKHMTWKAYIQVDPKSSKAATLETCSPKLGSRIQNNHVYASALNPFLWFQSTGGKKGCSKNDVPLTQLAKDIKSSKSAPSLSYIVADLCDDGNPVPCAKHAPAGMKAADPFLKSVVPQIEHSAAYKDNGLIVITSDEAPQTGAFADSTACCGVPSYPNLPSGGTSSGPTTTTPTTTTGTTTTGTSTTPTTTTGTTTTPTLPPCVPEFGTTCPTGGGGQVGLLLISKYVLANTQDPLDQFDHFSLLASLEDLFGLKRLGYASPSTLPVFSASNIYKAYTG